MINEAIGFLERELAYLQAQDGGDYLRALERYLEALRDEPLVAGLVEEIRAEARTLVEGLNHHNEALVPQLIRLRDELVTRVPEEDNTADERPSVLQGSWAWEMSIAGFDAAVAGTGIEHFPLEPTGAEDETLSGTVLGILQARLHTLQHERVDEKTGMAQYVDKNQRPDLDDLRTRVDLLAAEHKQVHRDFVNRKRSSPGPALITLEAFVADFNTSPPPRPQDREESAKWLSELLLKAHTLALLEEALYSKAPTGERAEELERLVDGLRGLVERLHHGLHQRARRVRSRVRLLHRFKTRCEMFDASDLRGEAEAVAKPEIPLAQAAARFFFDQGLNPLNEVTISGGLRPDVLEPFLADSIYIEAKQIHAETTNPAADIVAGAQQLYNTLRRMKGEPFNIREAFLLIFRRGGPDVELPSSYTVEDWKIYPLLVDIAPSAESGSRQKHQAVTVTVEDLAPAPAREAIVDEIAILEAEEPPKPLRAEPLTEGPRADSG